MKHILVIFCLCQCLLTVTVEVPDKTSYNCLVYNSRETSGSRIVYPGAFKAEKRIRVAL